MSILAKIAGAIAIVVISFFTTLTALDYFAAPPSADQMRADNAKQILATLEKYWAAKGAYPVLPAKDVATPELRKSLVEGNFIATIPADPPDAEATRYVSIDGKSFGLRVVQNKTYCLIEVRTAKSGWWAQPPPCQF